MHPRDCDDVRLMPNTTMLVIDLKTLEQRRHFGLDRQKACEDWSRSRNLTSERAYVVSMLGSIPEGDGRKAVKVVVKPPTQYTSEVFFQ